MRGAAGPLRGAAGPLLTRAFRRAALPLAWYYAITLALPLANGAAQSGAAFVAHALAVLVFPPILIVLVCAIQRTLQVVAGACRSTLPSAQAVLAGRRAAVATGARRLVGRTQAAPPNRVERNDVGYSPVLPRG